MPADFAKGIALRLAGIQVRGFPALPAGMPTEALGNDFFIFDFHMF